MALSSNGVQARNKLSGICSAVEKRVSKEEKQGEGPCGIKHRIEFVPCTLGVVYQIPFTCGKVYIGQTGRCLNIRLREHRSSSTGTASSHLALHCRDCACTPLLDKAIVLYKHRDQKAPLSKLIE